MQETLPIHFAPLQGYTEAIYRNAHATCFGGVDTYYTPFVRLEKGNFRKKDIRDIEPDNNHLPHLVPQLIASSPEKAETILALFIEKGYKDADINLGCPFPLLAKRHNGSGILPYPSEVKALLSIVAKYPQISFSVKMRLGWENPNECMQLIDLLNNTPLRQITIHPRIGKQQYKGDVDLKSFANFQSLCNHPLIYNGDIKRIEDIQSIHNQYPTLKGIMIGRGLLANPALALEYREGRKLSSDEMAEKIREMHTMLFQYYEQQLNGGEVQVLNKLKAFWEYLLPEADKKSLKAIHKSNRIDKYRLAVNNLLNKALF
ncbi:tRNA-dihydrouridine synthase family protein [Bacteroides sp.]|uniref:tRNA-dihydrouridine synthase family protein n=1 Tax=Bacteroides sp. TaxID=29523 RepID=UPI002631FD8E|nr:tRNA-dihydrouridine synthase family protein [Bacteroides sp.]MDD3036381.1 tRNA-dihydrouridine synthase family protein [Bacteroides sp.]